MNNERTEQIKKILMSEQQFNAPTDQLINDITQGKIKLLSALDICERINLPLDEFNELVKNSEPNNLLQLSSLAEQRGGVTSREPKVQYRFPTPDIYIAGQARWTEDTLKKWLLQGAK